MGDIISGLPDAILTHILSFLPTEEAVRTCILSKRWINVWASLPVLVFDDHTSRNDDLTEEEFQQREVKFLEFLGGVMLNRENLMLDTFKLKWCKNGQDTHILVCLCLRVAIMCSPRVLSIHIDIGTFNLPDSIFICTSIEEMSLYFQNNDVFHDLKPRSINLPFLKNLELGHMHLTDDIMRMLISGCPVLEELSLISCYLELNMISSNVLKKLELTCCVQWGGQMEISCPGVVSLSIIISLYMGGITLKNMSSLSTAVILFLGEIKDEPSNLGLRLLGGLSNVTNLKLHTEILDVMVSLLADISNCPTFKNLKCLELGVLDFDHDWNLVACLLQHSSNLKDLILLFKRLNEGATGEELEREIAFRHEYLEAVKIRCPGKNVNLVKEWIRYQDELVVTTAQIVIL